MNRKYKSVLIYISCFFILIQCGLAQNKNHIKIHKEDNQFFFYIINQEQDSIVNLQTALFKIKMPDSCSSYLCIDVKNGQFVKTNQTQQYRLKYIPGIKYEHQILKDSLTTHINGVCKSESNLIEVQLFDKRTNRTLIKKKYIVSNK